MSPCTVSRAALPPLKDVRTLWRCSDTWIYCLFLTAQSVTCMSSPAGGHCVELWQYSSCSSLHTGAWGLTLTHQLVSLVRLLRVAANLLVMSFMDVSSFRSWAICATLNGLQVPSHAISNDKDTRRKKKGKPKKSFRRDKESCGLWMPPGNLHFFFEGVVVK